MGETWIYGRNMDICAIFGRKGDMCMGYHRSSIRKLRYAKYNLHVSTSQARIHREAVTAFTLWGSALGLTFEAELWGLAVMLSCEAESGGLAARLSCEAEFKLSFQA